MLVQPVTPPLLLWTHFITCGSGAPRRLMRIHTRTHTHAHTRTRTHTHTRARTHTRAPRPAVGVNMAILTGIMILTRLLAFLALWLMAKLKRL